MKKTEYAEARNRYKYLLKAKRQSFRREKTTLLAAHLEPINVLESTEKYGLWEKG